MKLFFKKLINPKLKQLSREKVTELLPLMEKIARWWI